MRVCVKFKILPLLIIISLIQNAFPAIDEDKIDVEAYVKDQLVPLMYTAQKAVYENTTPVNKCHSDPTLLSSTCPPYLEDLIEDNYAGGLFGIINRVASNGSVATPDRICGNTQLKISPAEFVDKLVKSPYGSSQQVNLLATSMACVNKFGNKYSPSELSRARQYALSSLVYLPQQLSAGFRNMLESKSQLDLMLGNSVKEKCSEYPSTELMNYCNAVENCKHTKNESYFNNKAQELLSALKMIQSMNMQIMNLRKKRDSDEVARAKLELAVKTLKELYPMFENSSFKGPIRSTYYENQQITLTDVKASLKTELTDTRRKVLGKLKELKIAKSCILGERSNCGGMLKLLKETAPAWKPEHDLPFESYYSCIEDRKNARNVANKDLNEAAISVALLLTPIAVIESAGLVYKTGSLIKNATAVTKIKKLAILSSVAADTTISEVEAGKIYLACKPKLQMLESYQAKAPSCEIQEKKVDMTTDLSACHQQIFTGALSVAFSGIGLGLAVKSVQDVGKAIPENVLTLISKESDVELKDSLNKYISKLKTIEDKKKAISELSLRLSKIAKMKNYSPEEIKTAVKVYLKKCAN